MKKTFFFNFLHSTNCFLNCIVTFEQVFFAFVYYNFTKKIVWKNINNNIKSFSRKKKLTAMIEEGEDKLHCCSISRRKVCRKTWQYLDHMKRTSNLYEHLDLMVENYVKFYESRQNLSLLHQIFSQIFIQIAMILEQNDLDGNSIVIGKSKREQTGWFSSLSSSNFCPGWRIIQVLC